MVIEEFFSTTKTQPPTVSMPLYALFLLGIGLFLLLSWRFHSNLWFIKLSKLIQIGQLLALYSWYIAYHLPLSDSLPLYHCRIAMIGLVLLPDHWKLKRYLAYLGLIGAIFALGYPVLDPYDFPHITAISFVLGHYALLLNSLTYLLNHPETASLKPSVLILATFALDLVLLWVNHVTGGNYGILRHTPIINSSNVWLNYLAVSSVYSLVMVLAWLGFKQYQKAS